MTPTKTVRPMIALFTDTIPTMTYDPATIEAVFRVIHKYNMTYDPATIETVFRVIHQYKELLKPDLMQRLFMMVEADGDIKLQYAMQEVTHTHGHCRYRTTSDPTDCIVITIPYTQQGLLVTDSTVVVKEWYWFVEGRRKPIRMSRLELFIAIDGVCVDSLAQHFYWL